MNIWRFNTSSQLKDTQLVCATGSLSTVGARRSVKILLLAGALSVLAGPLCPASISGTSVAVAAQETISTPQNLGNPFLAKRQTYARNVWDMQLYKGKIYLGHGDSAANSGNTPIWSLDAETNKFTNEFLTMSEQVDEFFALDGTLYTLDHDPTGVENGCIYRLNGGTWAPWHAKENAGHLYGLARWEGRLHIAGATQRWGSSYATSDEGKTWAQTLTGSWSMNINGNVYNYTGNRTWMLLPVKGQLYAVQSWRSGTGAGEIGFHRFNPANGQFERFGATGALLSAGTSSAQSLRYKRQVALDDGSALTILVECVNDHQWNPLSLVYISEVKAGGIAALALPGGAKPYDILRRGDLVYVCAWDASKKQNVVFSLPASNVSAKPVEVLRFDAPTFARSFEESEGNFYFGLGSDVSPTPAQTGEIWKVAPNRKPVVPVVPQTPTVPKPAPSPTPLPPVVEPEAEPSGLASGLNSSYYKGMNLEGVAVAGRVEPDVNLSRGSAPKEAGNEKWSASYQGFIEAPITGQIKLSTLSDDGVRLFINDEKLIDNWTIHGVTWNSVTLNVTRGQKLPIKLQYFQLNGNLSLQLHWEWSGKRALVPTEYLWHTDTATLPSVPAVPIIPAVPAPLPTPTPTSAPLPTPTPTPAPLPTPTPTPLPTPTSAPTPIFPATSLGLSATYYKGMNLEGVAVAGRVEPDVNLSRGSAPKEAGNEKWSASYQGFIEAPITGQIKLSTLSDDGVRLFINDEKLIDNWTVHGVTWNSATINVTRGQKLPIKLQYFQLNGNSVLQLHWQWDIQNRVMIPNQNLSHSQ